METDEREKSYRIFGKAGLCGILLLLRPVLYYLFSRRRDVDDYASVDFSAIVFIIYAVVCFFAGVREIWKGHFGQKVLFRSPIIFFLIYTGLCFVSIAWSVNVRITGFRSFECLAMTLVIVGAIQHLFTFERTPVILKWSMIYCCWDILWSLGRLLAATTDINILLTASQMMATSFFYMALYTWPYKWYNYVIMIMSVFSMSTVGYVGMALGSLGSLFSRGKLKIIAVIGVVALTFAIAAMGPKHFLKETVFFDKEDVSIKYSSGRDHLMDASLKNLEKHPYGEGFFSGEAKVIYHYMPGAISAHNAIFSAALGTGYPGMVAIGIFFLAMWMCIFSKYIPRKYKPMLFGCLSVAFLHCMGNPSLGTRVFGAWIPCMYICVMVCSFYIRGKYYITEENEEDDIVTEYKARIQHILRKEDGEDGEE